MIQFGIVILLIAGAGQQDQVTISADRQERDGNIARLDGDVVVTYQDLRVEAGAATYDYGTRELTADGGMRFVRGPEDLKGDRLTMNVETKAGILTGANGNLGPGIFITAAEVERTEDGRYYLKDATITTCDGSCRGWSLSVARAVVDPTNSITARNSVFKLAGLPLFYLPYVKAPATERARSTGFLMPSTSTSTTKGRSVRESFYWAINRSADATFSTEYFSERGAAGSVNVRAVPSATSGITIDSLFVNDRLGQGGQSARILAFSDFGHGFSGVADMNLVSSIVFRQVYEEGFNVISSPLEDSRAFLTRSTPNANINFLYDRRGVFFPDQQSLVLRKFPSLEFSVRESFPGKAPAYISLEGGLSAVARRDAAVKTPAFIQRYDLHPAVEIPVVLSRVVDWSHRVGIRETFYSRSLQEQVVGGALNRLSFDYSSTLTGPRLERDFGNLRHVVEPSVDYRYVTGASHFRETLVVDDTDLVTNTSEVEYAITNRLFTTREILSWRLSQKYFLDPAFGGAIIAGKRNVFAPVLDISAFAFADGLRRFSPIVSTMRLSTSAATSMDLQVDYDTRDRLFRSAGIVGGAGTGQFLGQISYFFARRSAIQIANNQLRATLSYGNELKPGFSGGLQLSYDINRSVFQGAFAQVGYNTCCYGLSLEFSQFDIGARKESRFRFAFTLKNIGSYGTLRRQERLF